ncbi:MAG: hypothetical protein IPG72_14455 [Ardenticatenales bacterium]|nr:hypothetical protein [Ardenticatenales bacterium]
MSETVAGAPATPTVTAKPACELSEVEVQSCVRRKSTSASDEAGMTRAACDNLVQDEPHPKRSAKTIGSEIDDLGAGREIEYLVFNGFGSCHPSTPRRSRPPNGAPHQRPADPVRPRAVDDETASSPTSALTETVSADGATATFQARPASAGSHRR